MISLIIPTIGRYAQIKSTIRKISSNQHISEIIIVEDKKCAESELLQTLAKVNIKVISNSGTPGAYGARLYGVKNSKSRFVMFLDSDDYVISDYINNALSHIIKNPGTIISTNQVHGDKIVLYSKYSPYRYDFLIRNLCAVPFSGLLVEKNEIEKLDLNLSLQAFQDDDFLLNLTRNGLRVEVLNMLGVVNGSDENGIGVDMSRRYRELSKLITFWSSEMALLSRFFWRYRILVVRLVITLESFLPKKIVRPIYFLLRRLSLMFFDVAYV